MTTNPSQFWHAVVHNDLETVRGFLKQSPALAEQQHEGATALHLAAIHNYRGMVDLLLENGANLNAKDDEYGATPLGWANEKGHVEMVQYLYDRGTELDLHRAAAYGFIDRVRTLLEQDLSTINTVRGYGTPLHEAVLWGRTEIVSLLLKKGADPNMKNRYGKDAIEIAKSPVADGFSITLDSRLKDIEKARPAIIQLLRH